MKKVFLLDCTLRDGGYVNDWRFGEHTIKGFGKKIAQTGIEIYEIGFIKETDYDKNRAVFPDIESITDMIQPKSKELMYVGMIDMGNPLAIEKVCPYDGKSIDGVRVIFKKDKIDEAYDYCVQIQRLGYKLFVQFVGTDNYSDREFIDAVLKFNKIHPYAVSIVDSFGLIKKKQFLRYVYLADNNLDSDIILGYHAHNNLQQAFSNAESLVELNLQRKLCIDACVFGMGRGAGNLNLELFAEYMNENFGTQYRIAPMLEIMDEYLNEIYKERFWGYSLPLYLSATLGCHPNYAIYLAEKNSLTVKGFSELLNSIPREQKAKFSKENAEKFYRNYQDKWIDDSKQIAELTELLKNNKILLLAPGASVNGFKDTINSFIISEHPIVVAVNFIPNDFPVDYIFSSNMRRYAKIQGTTKQKCIITSNMKDAEAYDYMINFSRYASDNPEIIDNSGLMALKLFVDLNIKSVFVAGLDGYISENKSKYVDSSLEYDFSEKAKRQCLIEVELNELGKKIKIHFITPTTYKIRTKDD